MYSAADTQQHTWFHLLSALEKVCWDFRAQSVTITAIPVHLTSSLIFLSVCLSNLITVLSLMSVFPGYSVSLCYALIALLSSLNAVLQLRSLTVDTVYRASVKSCYEMPFQLQKVLSCIAVKSKT